MPPNSLSVNPHIYLAPMKLLKSNSHTHKCTRNSGMIIKNAMVNAITNKTHTHIYILTYFDILINAHTV